MLPPKKKDGMREWRYVVTELELTGVESQRKPVLALIKNARVLMGPKSPLKSIKAARLECSVCQESFRLSDNRPGLSRASRGKFCSLDCANTVEEKEKGAKTEVARRPRTLRTRAQRAAQGATTSFVLLADAGFQVVATRGLLSGQDLVGRAALGAAALLASHFSSEQLVAAFARPDVPAYIFVGATIECEDSVFCFYSEYLSYLTHCPPPTHPLPHSVHGDLLAHGFPPWSLPLTQRVRAHLFTFLRCRRVLQCGSRTALDQSVMRPSASSLPSTSPKPMMVNHRRA